MTSSWSTSDTDNKAAHCWYFSHTFVFTQSQAGFIRHQRDWDFLEGTPATDMIPSL